MEHRISLAAEAITLSEEITNQANSYLRIYQPAQRIAARRGTLYMLLEPAELTPGETTVCDLVAETIQSTFFAERSFGITAALLKAIQVANTRLYEVNTHARHSILFGLTCVVARENELYFAQVSPAITFLSHLGRISSVPSDLLEAGSNEFTPRKISTFAHALGAQPDPDIELYRQTVEPGDTLLLITTNAAPYFTTSQLSTILSSANLQQIKAGLTAIGKEQRIPSLQAITIKATAGGPATGGLSRPESGVFITNAPTRSVTPLEPSPVGTETRGRFAQFASEVTKTLTGFSGLVPGKHLSSAINAETSLQKNESDRAHKVSAQTRPETGPLPTDRSLSSPSPRISPRLGVSTGSQARSENGASQVRTQPTEPTSPQRREIPTPTLPINYGGSNGNESASALKSDGRTPKTEVTTHRESVTKAGKAQVHAPRSTAVASRRKSRGTSRAFKSPVFTVLVVFLIAGLVLVSSVYVSIQHQAQVRHQHFQQLLTKAQEDLQRAQSAPKYQARLLLQDARVQIQQAEALQVDSKQTAVLAEQINLILDKIEGTIRLDNLPPAIDFSLHSKKGAEPKSVLADVQNIYVLDSKLDIVYRIPLNSRQFNLILYYGQGIGSLGVNHLAAMTITGQGLFAVDIEGHLFRYDPSKLSSTAGNLPGDLPWKTIHLLHSFQNNLYVLSGQQIYKYTPQDGNYEIQPVSYFQGPNQPHFTTITDFTVDGSIYILESGVVLKYTDGAAQSFPATNLEQPLQQATSIFTTPDSPSIYVADAGSKRIVVFSKEGVFQHQFVSQYWTDLRSVFVNTAQHKMYVLTGQKLYIVNLTTLTPDKNT